MRLCNGKATLRILVAALALTAGLAATTAARAADAHFVLISHAPDSDSWWNTIKNAIKQADEDFNVELAVVTAVVPGISCDSARPRPAHNTSDDPAITRPRRRERDNAVRLRRLGGSAG